MNDEHEFDKDELLRHTALEHAIEWVKACDNYSSSEDVATAAQQFYNFLKGIVTNEDVQTSNH